MHRRDFLRSTVTLLGAAACGWTQAQEAGERPDRDPQVSILHPQARVPVSLIIDDSTCLVNLNRFAIPQFAEAWPDGRYSHDWRRMPVEIPDAFVRRFAQWCSEYGVKGKYSVVPYPACVGRLDRELPGWTRGELHESIELVREWLLPNWDIHPEMVTHTRIIDTQTGHPYPHYGPQWMENWNWTDGKSVDELTEYLVYALEILKNIDLPCEGITTPGGFGNRVLPELARASFESCRAVYGTEIPHYFRHLYSSGEQSVAPRVEYASGLQSDDPRCVVSIIGCTGDWTGGWDCSDRGDVNRFITPDLAQGRLVEVIERGEPAVLVCHWTGIYFNGEEVGFEVFQEVVRRLHARFNHLRWMKLSEIARYWAARELTSVVVAAGEIELQAPFACPDFTLLMPPRAGRLMLRPGGQAERELQEIHVPRDLRSGTWAREPAGALVCFDLPRGTTRLAWRAV